MASELRRPKGAVAKLVYELKQQEHNEKAEQKLSAWARKTTPEARRRYRRTAHEKALKSYQLLLSRIADQQGNYCRICKRRPPRVKLTLDHVKGKTYRSRDIAFYSRVKRYWAEYAAGVKFRLLCNECNARDGVHRQIEGRVHEEGAWTPKRPFNG